MTHVKLTTVRPADIKVGDHGQQAQVWTALKDLPTEAQWHKFNADDETTHPNEPGYYLIVAYVDRKPIVGLDEWVGGRVSLWKQDHFSMVRFWMPITVPEPPQLLGEEEK